MEPVCNQGLCGKRALRGDVFCRSHRRLKSRSYPEGLRVVFAPHPVSHVLYGIAPPKGAHGTVVKVSLGGRSGARTYLPGPAGGLLYVKWDAPAASPIGTAIGICGVSPLDVYREET
jgi:hypothetical protein